MKHNQQLLAEVETALLAGGPEALDAEIEFVVTAIAGFSLDRCRSVIRDLERGISPYVAVGHYEFSIDGRRASIAVNRGVMPPGADTSVVLQYIERYCSIIGSGWVLDIGCGSGLLGIASLLANTSARAIAIDVDQTACALTLRNGRECQVHRRLAVVRGRGAGPVSSESNIGLVIANLPFVRTEELQSLLPRFGTHAPRGAVDGGMEGLEVIEEVVAELVPLLRPGTALILHTAGTKAWP